MKYVEYVHITIGLLVALASTTAMAKNDHQKIIDFEDEVVEGMNKRPLDSLNQVSERDKRRKRAHLYRKRAGFTHETLETLSELKLQN